MTKLRKVRFYILVFLIITAFSVWLYIVFNTESVVSINVQIPFTTYSVRYVRTKNGRQMLVGGGPKGFLLKALKKVELEGNGFIDVLVLTSLNADHIAGFIDILKSYAVGAVIIPKGNPTSKTYAQLESLLK